MLVLCVGGVVAYADFGSGVAVLAEGTEIVKSAISGKKIVFSDLDFKKGLCISDFEKIEITAVPETNEGTLMLAGRRVNVGTVIKRKNIGALVFIPASAELEECKFSFKTEDFADGAEVNFILKFTNKVNYAPKTDNVTSCDISTQREIGVFGKMSATDTEGDKLEYVVIRYPEVGLLKVLDANSGEFLYTPPDEYVGKDTFTYVAKDTYGNYSKPKEVSVSITERACEAVYADMINHAEYNAAVALTAMGVVDGRLIGDGVYFMPEDTVSVAEFVTMAMKCAGIKPNTALTETYFDDNDEIAPQLVSYVATAAKLGIVQGSFVDGELLLSPNSPITAYEAAMIMAAITDATVTDVSFDFGDNPIPVWSKAAISEMCSLGIFDTSYATSDATRSLTKSECVGCLYRMMKSL